ncbi:MAG: hypothetical protein IPO19_09605 [Rhodoferax sp.]|nr:hypothetical protein [Rhodoferax sp.]MBK9236277.1 hypothetical protein [Rhodoferax sp.]
MSESVHIESISPNGTRQSRHAVITDLFNKGGAEYLTRGDGEISRLDALVSVDARSSLLDPAVAIDQGPRCAAA